MTNLIPNYAKKKITLEYWVRVVTSWLFLWSGTLIISGLLLIPVYVLTDLQVSVYESSANAADENVTNFAVIGEELKNASKQAIILQKNTAHTPLSDYLNLFASIAEGGITLRQTIINRNEEGVAPIIVMGTAINRQSLSDFRDDLLLEPAIEAVDLPISNLAEDQDIFFTLTITMNNEYDL